MAASTKENQGLPLRMGWIFLLALTVRGLTWIRTDPVAFDSALYFEMADFIRRGPWRAALAYPFPPLYPALISGLQLLGMSPETAGLLIACAADLLVMFPLWAIARAATGETAARGTAFLWAIHPYAVRLGVQALTDAPTAFFIAVAVWAGIRGLENSPPAAALSGSRPAVRLVGWAVGAGGASGLAYLLRPEGIEPALVLAAFYAVESRRAKGQSPAAGRRVWRRAAWAVAPLAGWAIVAVPYVAYISMEAGSLTLSKKKSPAALFQSIVSAEGPPPSALRPPAERGTPPAGVAEPVTARSQDPMPQASGTRRESGTLLARSLRGAYVFQRPLVNGLHPLVLVFGFLGALVLPRWRLASGAVARRVLVSLGGLHLVVLIGLAASRGPTYLGGHHFFPMVVYALPFAGLGLTATIAWLAERLRAPRLGPICALSLLVAVAASQSIFRRPGRGTALRPAAEWIRGQAPGGPVVVTDMAKLTYHAGAARMELLGGYEQILQGARMRGAQFVAFYPDMIGHRSPDFLTKLNPADLELARAFPEPSASDPSRRFVVYRLKPK